MVRSIFISLCVFALLIGGYTPAQSQDSVVLIKVLPEKVTLRPGMQIRFTAQGYNYNNRQVFFNPEWSATGGSLVQVSSYTAAYTASYKSGIYTVIVTDPRTGAQGSAIVYVTRENKPIITTTYTNIARVEISPKYIELMPGQTIQFRALAYNVIGSQIQLQDRLLWNISGGTMNNGGIYRAGTLPGTYSVKVTVRGMTATAKVVINSAIGNVVRIEIAPAQAHLGIYDTVSFTAKGYDNMGNIVGRRPYWEATGGSIDDTGVYRAGATPGSYFVKAIMGEVSTSVPVIVDAVDLGKITVYPHQVTLDPGQIQKFQVVAYNKQGAKISAIPLWNASGGVISQDGTYKAGNAHGKYFVVANVGKLSKRIPVTIRHKVIPSTIVIVPTEATLKSGHKLQFRATVYDNRGEQLTVPVKWKSPGGQISAKGLFTAGNVPGKYFVKAFANDLVGEAWVEILPSPPQIDNRAQMPTDTNKNSHSSTVITKKTETTTDGVTTSSSMTTDSSGGVAASFRVIPDKISLKCGEQYQLSVVALDHRGRPVKPQVQYQATGGRVDAKGIYTAGNTPGNYIIVVTELLSKLQQNVRVYIYQDEAPQTVQTQPPMQQVPMQTQPRVQTPQKYAHKSIQILQWNTGYGGTYMGQILIQGRITDERSHLLQLVLYSHNGTTRVLSEIFVRNGQTFKFTGRYLRHTTRAVGLTLYDKNMQTIYTYSQ